MWTRKKLSMKFSRSDAAVTVAVVIFSALLFFQFWKDLNAMAARDGEMSLGSIVFRRGSATRRSPSGMNWERLRNLSPVYRGDTIRTSDFSEAALFFEDGTDLDLFENSMIKLNFAGSEKELEFLGGRISLSGGEGRAVAAGAGTVAFSEGSRVSLSRTGDEISVGVSGGTATLTDAAGRREVIRSSQELRMNAEGGDYEVIEHSAILLQPSQNARLLSLGEDGEVSFSWEATSPDSLSGAVALELSSSPDFESPESLPLKAGSAGLTARRKPGVWYWRLRDERGAISGVSRFSLAQDLLPKPILPKDGEEYRYRKIPPAVSFSWSEMENASAYIFEVSAEPEFRKPIIRSRTSLQSLKVGALDEGLWYWRVLPVPAGELLGGGAEPTVRRIHIARRDEMERAVLLQSLDGAFYQLQVMDDRGVPFSWEPQREAAEYQIAVADNPGMDSPKVLLSTEAPYAFLRRGDAEALYREGVFYWSVRWRDAEGNLSPWSPARKLRGIDGTVAVRLSYPPDGYTIADSLMSNTRFAWKSNVPGRTVFQVSRDPGFDDIAYQEDVNMETLLGKNWEPGEWSWRIRTFNVDGTIFLETPPRRFRVVEPFEGPTMLSPEAGRLYTFRDGDAQTIRWEKIPEADYYTLKLVPAGGGDPMYQQALITSEEVSLSFDDFPDGSYKALIQGFALEKPMSTRQIGLIRENPFSLRKLMPIELVSPTEGEAFEGLSALKRGVPLVWKSKTPPDATTLRVYSDRRMTRSVFLSENGPSAESVRRLPEGRYFWTVTGSFGDFDISARSVGRFIVKPIPPLPPAVLTGPPEDAVYGPEELRTSRRILFSWEAVPGATAYYLAIYARGDREKPVVSAGPLPDTSYLLKDLSVLDKGEFVWVLFGERRDAEGYVEQPGTKAEGLFSILLPALDTPSVKSGNTFYGR